MPLSSINAQAALTRGLVELKQTMMDLQRQLATGKRAETHGGLGPDRSLALGLRARLSAMEGYESAGQAAGLRLGMLQNAVSRIGTLGEEARRDAVNIAATGGPAMAGSAQTRARGRLAELVGALNTDVAGRYLLSGTATDTRPVPDMSLLLDGDGTRGGLRQVIAERRAADLGTAGLGRLGISAVAGDAVTVTEDGPHPFGFKITGATVSVGGNVTASAPAGAPASTTITFTGQPAVGEAIRLTLALPDGSQEQIELTASESMPAGSGSFAIGATTAATAANFRAALIDAVQALASGPLAAASALRAGDDFFVTGGAPPQRVVGPPLTATALAAGTPADTVFWYQGDNAAGDPRATATAEVDRGILAAHGARANEAPFARTIASIAVLAGDNFPSSDPTAAARYEALSSRIAGRLEPNGAASVAGVAADLAAAQQTIKQANERRQTDESGIRGLLDGVEGIVPEEIAASVLTLQTRLQASYELTSRLSQMSLAHFL